MTSSKKRILLVSIALLVILATVFALCTYTGPGPLAIEIVADKPSYMLGEPVTFSIYVNNFNSWPVKQPTSINYQMSDAGSMQKYVEYAGAPTFPANSRTFLENYCWDQMQGVGNNRTLVKPGSYSLKVTFDGAVDYGEPGTCTVIINPTQP